MSGCWCSLMASIFKAKLLYNVLRILALRDKNRVFHLLDLENKKVGQFSHKTHLKFRLHLMDKMLNHLIRHSSKHNVINIDLCYHESSFVLLNKQGLVSSSLLVTLIDQKLCTSFIPSPKSLLQSI